MENINQLYLLYSTWALYIGTLSLLGGLWLASALFSLRLLFVLVSWEKLISRHSLTFSRQHLVIALISLLGITGMWTYLIIKPDQKFYSYRGEKEILLGNYSQAAYYYRKLVDWGDTSLVSLNNLAICSYQLGDFPEAIRLFSLVHQQSPLISPQSYILCAQAYLKIGQPQQAQDLLQKAMTLSWPPAQKEKLRSYLDKLQKEPQN